MEKLNVSSCKPWWKLKSTQLQLCQMTFGFGPNIQERLRFRGLWPQLYLVLLLSGNTCLKNYSSKTLNVISTKLGQKNHWTKLHQGYAQIWGQRSFEVTRVNDLHCVKMVKKGQMKKINMPSCRPSSKLKKFKLWRNYTINGFGSKVKKCPITGWKTRKQRAL